MEIFSEIIWGLVLVSIGAAIATLFSLNLTRKHNKELKEKCREIEIRDSVVSLAGLPDRMWDYLMNESDGETISDFVEMIVAQYIGPKLKTNKALVPCFVCAK